MSVYRDVSFTSKLFKVYATRKFRNCVFKGNTKHASITTQTNFNFVLSLQAEMGGSFCPILLALKTVL
jgi:hypothetical protein